MAEIAVLFGKGLGEFEVMINGRPIKDALAINVQANSQGQSVAQILVDVDTFSTNMFVEDSNATLEPAARKFEG